MGPEYPNKNDQILKRKFEGFTKDPPDTIWTGIVSDMPKRRDRFFYWIFLGASLLVFSIAAFLFLNKEKLSNTETSEYVYSEPSLTFPYKVELIKKTPLAIEQKEFNSEHGEEYKSGAEIHFEPKPKSNNILKEVDEYKKGNEEKIVTSTKFQEKVAADHEDTIENTRIDVLILSYLPTVHSFIEQEEENADLPIVENVRMIQPKRTSKFQFGLGFTPGFSYRSLTAHQFRTKVDLLNFQEKPVLSVGGAFKARYAISSKWTVHSEIRLDREVFGSSHRALMNYTHLNERPNGNGELENEYRYTLYTSMGDVETDFIMARRMSSVIDEGDPIILDLETEQTTTKIRVPLLLSYEFLNLGNSKISVGGGFGISYVLNAGMKLTAIKSDLSGITTRKAEFEKSFPNIDRWGYDYIFEFGFFHQIGRSLQISIEPTLIGSFNTIHEDRFISTYPLRAGVELGNKYFPLTENYVLMKNGNLIVVSFLTIFCLLSCQKQDILTDDQLIDLISQSSLKVVVAPTELPYAISEHVNQVYFETFVESAFILEEKGFELLLGSEDRIYFAKDGRPLRGNKGLHRGCGWIRKAIDPANLPEAVKRAVQQNFDKEIKKAKELMNGTFLIALKNRIILHYDEMGILLHQGHTIFHCDKFGNKILLHEVRTEIVEYIKQQCIGCEIKAAFSRNGRIYIGVLNGDVRMIMVFNQAGDFLFSRK